MLLERRIEITNFKDTFATLVSLARPARTGDTGWEKRTSTGSVRRPALLDQR